MTKFADLTIEDVLKKMPEGSVGVEARALVRRAYNFAEEAHAGQFRKSGEPYLQHCLHVASLLADLHLKPTVIAAGLLHDVLEDCDVKLEQLEELFGAEVAVMVDGVTKLKEVDRLTGLANLDVPLRMVSSDKEAESDSRVRDAQESESLRKMFIAMAKHPRVMYIKLADRLHNMRTLGALSPERQTIIARETMDIFAPLANRIGVWRWKGELEDLSFRYLNPTMYSNLASFLESSRQEREERVKHHITVLQNALKDESIPAQVKGRPKHIYSIYRKMQRKNVPFSQIYDTEGLRVIVETDPQCYQVLGIVHGLWRPVPGEFDDYIAHPKPNLYRSLHTAIFGEDGRPLEIQIRTVSMDEIAENGMAAHWRYKEAGHSTDPDVDQEVAWMRQSVQDFGQESGEAFVELMKADIFQDRVFVFTPQAKLIDLPAGATPLDFAYHIHTDIGHRCRGAKVDGRWVTLNYQLKTGERVEIITSKTVAPSRDWLNEELGYVKTHRAREKIAQWFRRQGREDNVAQGGAIVERELKRLGLTDSVEDVARLFAKRYQRIEDFLAAVGIGDVSSERIANRLEELIQSRTAEKAKDIELPEPVPEPPQALPSSAGKVFIRGTGDLLTHVARCCNPLPGEAIIGYVTRGKGVTIHKRECPNVLQMGVEDRERLIEVEWGKEETTFPVRVLVRAYDRSRLFHDISGVVANENLNMTAVTTSKRDRYNVVPIYITMEVPNLAKLHRVLGKIEQVSNVIDARRVG